MRGAVGGSGILARGSVATVVAALVAVVLLAGPVTLAAGAAPVAAGASLSPAVNSTGPAWAYGGSAWVNASGTTTAAALNGTATYSIHAYLGLQVLLREYNTSATTFELTANRTMVGDLFAQYCEPTCASPQATANLTLRALEVAHATANFTTTTTVVGTNGTIPALGIVNSSVRDTANLSESEVLKVFGRLGTRTGTTSLTVATSSDASVAFGPPLGLVPEPLSSASSWRSESNYTGTGSWTVSFSYAHDPIYGLPTSSSQSYNGSVNRSGTVSVLGASGGTIRFHDGQSAEAVALRVEGPFDAREGFILVPSGGDLFGGSGKWQPDASGATTAGTSAVDYATLGGRPSILASATAYAASSSTTDATPMGSSGLATMTSGSDQTPPGTLQAQPEPYGKASQLSGCLVSGGCPSAAASHGIPLGAVVGVVAVVGLVVVVVGLVVARQPPRKEPVTPYASLYPPGTGGAVRVPPGRPPAPASPPPSSDDDPLDHLW